MKTIWLIFFVLIYCLLLSAQQVDAVATGSNNAVKGTAATGIGVHGQSVTNVGVLGESIDNAGVYGYSNSDYGVYGTSISYYGVYGTSTSNTKAGVFGSSNNFGIHGSGAATGVYGESTDNIGVLGTSTNGAGVIGIGATYDFNAIGPGVNYGTTSSRRWKKNINNISDPLNMIAKLRGVYFDWDQEHGGKFDIGFIAEEVGAVIPEIVVFEENGIDASGMDYSKMTPLLVEAINAMRREYQSLIQDQTNKIQDQSNKIIAL